jgi:hypothetical protein
MHYGLQKDSLKAQLVPAIPEILQNGYLGERMPVSGRNDGIVAFRHITGTVSLNGKTIPVGVSVGEDRSGNLFYNLNHHPESLKDKGVRHSDLQILRGTPSKDSASEALDRSLEDEEANINLFILE